VLSAVFFLVCGAGSAAAVTLAVHEARSTDAVVADVTSKSRSGLSTQVTVDVRNSTDTARCAAIRVVGRDRAGRDLGSVDAGQVRLAPHATSKLSAALELTAKQYAERLTLVLAVVAPCR
jgi:mRNA-degrading endonuclease toxin of MazEF toxin-antitoxin module